MYVSDAFGNSVTIYDQSNPKKPVGSLSSGLNRPAGLFVDAAGNLFAANSGSATVVQFPPGSSVPTTTFGPPKYGNPALFAWTVTVCPDGTLYQGTNFGVLVYPAGATQPTSSFDFAYIDGLACDAHSNVYASEYYENFGQVEEFGPGGTGGTTIPLGHGYLTIDAEGDLVINDKPWVIDFYHAGSYTTPFKSIGCQKCWGPGQPRIAGFALDQAEANLWVTLPASVDSLQRVNIATGKRTAVVRAGLGMTGVVTTPADSIPVFR